MAMFKAFKPSGMEKIARAMGYQGNMQGFQDYLAQDPMRQQQMQGYQQKAMQMAKGGMVRKMQTGGDVQKSSPYTFGPSMEASVPPMYGPEGTYSLTGRPAPLALTGGQPGGAMPVMNDPRGVSNYIPPRGGEGQPITMDTNYGQPLMSADGTMGTMVTQQPDYSGMTYEQAQSRLMQMDMKSPAEQAAIDAAIARGPVAQTPQTQLPQQAVPTFTMPEPTTTTVTQYQDADGNVYASESDVPDGVTTTPIEVTQTKQPTIGDIMAQQAFSPGLPTGGAVAPVGMQATADQLIDPTTGQVSGAMAVPTAMATTAMAVPQQESDAAQVQASTAAPAVASALDATTAATGTVSPNANIVAAQQTASSVGSLDAAQGNATLIDNPVQRELQQGELISGAADAEKAAKFTEQIEAAQATPSQQATVQGQLAQLTANFDAKNPPAWAAGALRNATAQMAARGLGSSSLAGQALVQAAMESALPIAQADAATTAQFESQNLSNRQQRAMLAAQQRADFIGMEFTQDFQARVQNAAKISDIANMNFTAEQQVQLENSRLTNTMNLQNLSNSQAMVMAEAAALAQLDTANLNNRQQAAVQNAQAFLQMDMANLSNRQQTSMFKAQQRIQSLFTDQAAENAARQFNATSENQVNQFFANLNSQTSQFNAAQSNAQAQFNAGQRNTVERFNAEINNQRDQFNATNQLAIAQNNAVWRREIATANTAAINRANELNATAALNISKQAYDNLWTYYSDTMEFAWKSAENELDRINSMSIAQLSADATTRAQQLASSSAAGTAIGGLISTLGGAAIEFGLGNLF